MFDNVEDNTQIFLQKNCSQALTIIWMKAAFAVVATFCDLSIALTIPNKAYMSVQ